MTGVPRTKVEDAYIDGLSCAVCGQSDLYVQHLPAYPDFVTCRTCGAAFVVEDTGERVMYGKIPDGYPETTEFALRQWVWLEAVERRATEERPATAAPSVEAALRASLPAESAGVEEAAAEAAEEPGSPPDWLAARLGSGMPAGVPIPTEPEPYRPPPQGVPLSSDTGPTQDSLPAWLRDSSGPSAAPPPPRPAPAAAPVPVVLAAASPQAPIPPPSAASEPPPTQRHRVVIRGDRIRMPITACAHCRNTPAPDRLPVPGSLPRTGGAGRRQTKFMVPLCRDCNRRATSRTPEQRNARLMALLTGALVGLVLVVVVLATGLVPFATSLALGMIILGVFWLIGFGLTAGLLLSRTGRIAPLPDAEFVRTTLRVVADPVSPQTSFEWRQAETARIFHEANASAAAGGPSIVDEPAG